MSGRVGSAISKSGMVEDVVLAVGIASPSVSVQELFLLPVSWPTFWVLVRLSASSSCKNDVGSTEVDDIMSCTCAHTRRTCPEYPVTVELHAFFALPQVW